MSCGQSQAGGKKKGVKDPEPTHTVTKRLVWHLGAEDTNTLLLLCLIWRDFSESKTPAWKVCVCEGAKMPMRREREREGGREGGGGGGGGGGETIESWSGWPAKHAREISLSHSLWLAGFPVARAMARPNCDNLRPITAPVALHYRAVTSDDNSCISKSSRDNQGH